MIGSVVTTIGCLVGAKVGIIGDGKFIIGLLLGGLVFASIVGFGVIIIVGLAVGSKKVGLSSSSSPSKIGGVGKKGVGSNDVAGPGIGNEEKIGETIGDKLISGDDIGKLMCGTNVVGLGEIIIG
mmetsp:Transcript_29182/g.44123  ORF Transcript_29182/g.44123 Transcript_29182/m.44123 type:complete len:125 (+) Transcript_29182:374-748(+)